ncbi:hypothetical protein JG687_00004115 [Phytophthora cactorum]|uniref:Uncharacterized protein n=2 Tax=Phytophthora TaxID=4783 RepID=A0A8J5JDW5_9STRA|nr:hypothetical protein PC128_g4761 [Phytophthora cactorum]KAG4062966.1 hypothetical protein PC123_g2214 [Phytophthora cactorum]KAG6967736.1 hypothetical protein JG687_00004115 [Phytophthora cactorum]KAG6976945.1 hypothetical protein JG688_00000825 [Phytophthora aleatoria]
MRHPNAALQGFLAARAGSVFAGKLPRMCRIPSLSAATDFHAIMLPAGAATCTGGLQAASRPCPSRQPTRAWRVVCVLTAQDKREQAPLLSARLVSMQWSFPPCWWR